MHQPRSVSDGTVREFDEALGCDWAVASRLAAINKSFCIVEMAPDGTILHANPNFLRLMGYRLADLKGRHHAILCFDDFAQSWDYRRFWNELLGGHHVDNRQLRRHANGSAIWLQAIYVPVMTPQGQVQRILKIAIDITEAQVLKSQAESQLAALSRSSGIVEFDLEGNVLSANDAFLAIMGYEADEVLGQNHVIFCDPDYVRSREYEAFWAGLRAGDFQRGVFRRRAGNGRRVWISASYNPILDPQGNLVRIIKFAQDITESHEAGVRNAQEIKSLKSLQAVVQFDVNGLILDVNERFLAATGFQRREILGVPVSSLFGNEVLDDAGEASWWHDLAAGRGHSGEFACTTKSGKPLWWKASFNPIMDIDGDLVMVCMVGLDATREKTAMNEYFAKDVAIDSSFIRVEFDMQGRVLAMNDKALAFYGYQPHEVVGMDHRAFALEDDGKGEMQAMNRLWERLNEGQVVCGRFKRCNARGEEQWLEAAYSPVSDLSGFPVKVIAYAFDISREMLIEQRIDGDIREMQQVMATLATHLHEKRAD